MLMLKQLWVFHIRVQVGNGSIRVYMGHATLKMKLLFAILAVSVLSDPAYMRCVLKY